MKFKLRSKSSNTVVMLRFALAYIFCSVVGSLLGSLGILLVPICSGLLLNLLCLDFTKFKAASIVCSLISVVFELIYNNFNVYYALFTVIIAVCIYLCLSFEINKAESAFYVSVLFILAVLVDAYITTSILIGDRSPSAVFEALKNQLDQFRIFFVDVFSSAMTSSEAYSEINVGEMVAIFDEMLIYYINLLPSMVAVFCFMLAGFTLKYSRKSLLNTFIREPFIVLWRFKMPKMFAGFFLSLAFLNLFVSGGVFGLTVANLYFVFKFVFAYCGAKLVLQLLSIRFGKLISGLIFVCCLAFMSSVALDFLAVYAAVGAFIKFKVLPDKPNKNN